MSAIALHPAAGCLLQIAELTLSVRGEVVLGDLHLEIAADPSCETFDLSLRGVEIAEKRARQRLGDGGGAKLGEERWEIAPSGLQGGSVARLHAPELLSGDRVFVDLELSMPSEAVSVSLGAASYLAVEAKQGTVVPSSDPAKAGERYWAKDARADLVLTVSPPGAGPEASPAPALPAGEVHVERQIVLHIPPGDPQIRLFPGGGSSVEIADALRLQPSETPRLWPLDAPDGALVKVETQPPRMAKAVDLGARSALAIEPSEGIIRATVSWEQPDAPTYGERDDGLDALSVSVERGEIVWDKDAWLLAAVAGEPVVPPREVLVSALDRRFRERAIPEPGAPMELRGQSPSWETAALLRPALLQRIAVGSWPNDPLWPRKLTRARKGGALTPTEAALVLWLYACQLHFDARWVLVRPAPDGPGSRSVPSGYRRALVALTLQGETRFVDPTCSVCAPFEIPPDLEGSSALAIGLERTPDESPGRHEVRVEPEQITWELSGSAALALRLWLEELPQAERPSALARWMAGPGAVLEEVEGLSEAGADVRAVARRGSGLIFDPLNSAPSGSSTVWFPWVGERVVRWSGAEMPEASVQGEGLSYERRIEDGLIVERLTVEEREIDAGLVQQMDEARHQSPPEPEEAPVEAPVAP